jgi:hypothetical protein
MAEGGGFDEGEVVVVIGRAAEAVAAESAEEAAVGSTSAGAIDGDGKEVGGVGGTLTEVVLAVLASGG